MAVFTINGTDYSDCVAHQGLKAEKEVLLADGAGRNAKGKMVFDIVARKWKITIKTPYLTQARAKQLLDAISTSYTNSYTFDTPFGSVSSITCYHGNLNSQYYWVLGATDKLVEPMTISLIEV